MMPAILQNVFKIEVFKCMCKAAVAMVLLK